MYIKLDEHIHKIKVLTGCCCAGGGEESVMEDVKMCT